MPQVTIIGVEHFQAAGLCHFHNGDITLFRNRQPIPQLRLYGFQFDQPPMSFRFGESRAEHILSMQFSAARVSQDCRETLAAVSKGRGFDRPVRTLFAQDTRGDVAGGLR